MPEFILNRSAFVNGEPSNPGHVHPFYKLDAFAKGYVEAMFFTNGGTGDERENLLNDWGVEKLTKTSVDTIRADCDRFQALAADVLQLAYDAGYEVEQAGRDFWYTRQGHGVGFSDREALQACAEDAEAYEAATQEIIASGHDNAAWSRAVERRNDITQRGLAFRLEMHVASFSEATVEAWRGWIHVR